MWSRFAVFSIGTHVAYPNTCRHGRTSSSVTHGWTFPQLKVSRSALALLCDVFLDIVSLTTGREWADPLESALKSADVFEIPATPNSTIHCRGWELWSRPKEPDRTFG
jgi:hypothetical protein